MTVPTSSGRQRLLQQIASRVPHSASEDCVRVGIDGVDGAGKTVLADELAEQLHSGHHRWPDVRRSWPARAGGKASR